MESASSRVVEATPESSLFAMLAYIMPMCRLAPRAQALVVFPGLGEISREIDAIREWNAGHVSAKFFLIAGQNQTERNSITRSLENLKKSPFGLLRTKGVYSQGDAKTAQV